MLECSPQHKHSSFLSYVILEHPSEKIKMTNHIFSADRNCIGPKREFITTFGFLKKEKTTCSSIDPKVNECETAIRSLGK